MHRLPPFGPALLPTPPDLRGPNRFLLSLFRRAGTLAFSCAASNTLFIVAAAFLPWLAGRAIDQGITRRDPAATAIWVGWLTAALLLLIVMGTTAHTFFLRLWLTTGYDLQARCTQKITELGTVLTRRFTSGEVVSVATTDCIQTLGRATSFITEGIAALCAYVTVSILVLTISVELGLVVLIGSPLLLLLAAPLLRPLKNAQEDERNRNSDLTSIAADIVAGLRILRGIGGEATFGRNYSAQSQYTRRAGVAVGLWQAAVDAMSVLLSGVMVVVLAWLGIARLRSGELSVGELIALLGYAIFLLWPLSQLFAFFGELVAGRVAAEKTIALLRQRSPWEAPTDPPEWPDTADLVDERSGVRLPHGQLSVLVCADPDAAAAVAHRLARYLPPSAAPTDDEETPRSSRRARAEARRRRTRLLAESVARDEELARGYWGVRLSGPEDRPGHDLGEYAIDTIRDHIMLADSGALVFAGTLREAIDPLGRADRVAAEDALLAASAEDVWEALPQGWQGRIDERGRGLSGGQRQRLILARALLADPDTLILIEPTSAVDAHTEARIARRLPEYRAGRTTLITSASPLVLHHADHVIWLGEDGVRGQGTHTELLEEPGYRAVVIRDQEALR